MTDLELAGLICAAVIILVGLVGVLARNDRRVRVGWFVERDRFNGEPGEDSPDDEATQVWPSQEEQ